MAKTTEIKEVVRTTFDKVFGSDEECAEREFDLILLEEHEKINHLSFVITQFGNGIVCEFSVSDTGIYEASSKGDLLSSVWTTTKWLEFIKLVKERLGE